MISSNKIKRFGLAIITLIVAIILFVVFIPVGIAHNVLLSIKRMFSVTFFKGIELFFSYWIIFVVQIWWILYELWFFIALIIDYIGNVVCGPLIIYLISTKKWRKEHGKNSIAGKKMITISAAVGQVQYTNGRNNFGMFFCYLLDIGFKEKDHALNAYIKYLKKSDNDTKRNSI